APVRVIDGVADGGIHVLERLERRTWVDDARAGGHVDFDQPVARKEGSRRATTVEGYDERVSHGAVFARDALFVNAKSPIYKRPGAAFRAPQTKRTRRRGGGELFGGRSEPYFSGLPASPPPFKSSVFGEGAPRSTPRRVST